MSPLIALPKNKSIEDEEYRKEICREWIPKIIENFPANSNHDNILSHFFYCQDADADFEPLRACDEWLGFIYFKNLKSINYYQGRVKK